jgi:hypothetical protein
LLLPGEQTVEILEAFKKQNLVTSLFSIPNWFNPHETALMARSLIAFHRLRGLKSARFPATFLTKFKKAYEYRGLPTRATCQATRDFLDLIHFII